MTMKFNSELFSHRRDRLAKIVKNGAIIVWNDELPARYDVNFHPDADCFYLSSIQEPNAALVITVKNSKVDEVTAYCMEKDPVFERWNGKLHGTKAYSRILKLNNVKPFTSVNKIVSANLGSHENVYLKFDTAIKQSSLVMEQIAKDKYSHPYKICDLRDVMMHLRSIKDEHEVQLISASCELAATAHKALMTHTLTAKNEAELAARLSLIYNQKGAEHAFLPIVACGKNACVAHYVANNTALSKDKLILIDSGCMLSLYNSDITRVFPISGKFSPAQKDLYSIVLEAQQKAIAKIKPGASLFSCNKAASLVLARGLRFLGICKGTDAKILTSKAFSLYYYHSIGHMIGLHVHDPWRKDLIGAKELQFKKNMVLTIEPGLYLDDAKSVPKEIRNTGIRIEDTLLVTIKSSKNLTVIAPKLVKQISA